MSFSRKAKAPVVMRTIAAFLAAIAVAPAAAWAAAHVELVDSASAIDVRDGAPVVVPLTGAAKPGQRLRYTIVARNSGDRPAADLMPVTKISASERYVDGSAGATAEFSVDGGKTWSREPMVRVTNPGGAITVRRALPAEYDAIRWVDPVPLAPGARVTFGYDVIVE